MNTVAEFKPGMRVRLVSTTDRFTKLQPGDRGTVLCAGDQAWLEWGRFVDVAWDSGSNLTMLLDEGDVVEITEPNPAGPLFRAER